jgi:hypothetical protein
MQKAGLRIFSFLIMLGPAGISAQVYLPVFSFEGLEGDSVYAETRWSQDAIQGSFLHLKLASTDSSDLTPAPWKQAQWLKLKSGRLICLNSPSHCDSLMENESNIFTREIHYPLFSFQLDQLRIDPLLYWFHKNHEDNFVLMDTIKVDDSNIFIRPNVDPLKIPAFIKLRD